MAIFTFDSNCDLKKPSSDELAKADEESSILVYLSGVAEDGQPYYAYVAVKPSRYGEFQARSLAKQTIILDEYGLVITCGFASSPPAEVVAMMRDAFGFDDDYLEKLRRELTSEYRIFLKQIENKRIDDAVAILKKKASKPDYS
jgi:hypothetical protein